MKREFLDLGKHPIANAFLKKEQFDDEFFFDLRVCWDDETKLVSINEFVEPTKIFNVDYPYNTSNSVPMIEHFRETAKILKKEFQPKTVLEIGSNTGEFISNFPTETSICVEPCDNFAKITGDKGYRTRTEFWTTELSEKVKDDLHGKVDLIYAANCICHIHDLNDTFNAIHNIISDEGVFIFEDPSLLRILERGSYDQIYDEHPHIFSVTALNNLLKQSGLEIFRVLNLSVHGGSNRIYVGKEGKVNVEKSVEENLQWERDFGIEDFSTYEIFAERVSKNKKSLMKTFETLKGSKIMCIGATAKSTTVFNYCGVTPSIIEVITDTTTDKQNTYSPGVHIPVVSPDEVDMSKYDYAFLGAWNFSHYIRKNQTDFKGQYITHIPEVRFV
tara:strand:- start:1377 stop:2540 length:1164 start_codon:yes stop_codon:yes gene_type:complete